MKLGSTEKAQLVQGASEQTEGGLSRRGFLAGGGVLAGGALMSGLLASCAPRGSEASATEFKQAKGHVTHVSQICTGCETCALVCALSHEQLINPKLARNTVKTDVQVGYVTDVLYCQQCDDPKCLKACATGALRIDDVSGARIIDQDTCIGCQTCLNACIFAPSASRIKYNPDTNTCFKCDLCGGDPLCVRRCPLGSSQLSWEEYTIIRPQIDDYVEETTEGAIDSVVFEKEYSGPHAGKAQDVKDWAMITADGGVGVVGQITSSDGAELRVKMYCDFYDASGGLLGTSEEHQWCLTLHETLPIEFHFEIADPSQIATVKIVGNISYWISTEDEEY